MERYQYKLMQQTSNLIRKNECIQSICLISHLQFRKNKVRLGWETAFIYTKSWELANVILMNEKCIRCSQLEYIFIHSSTRETKDLYQMNIIFVCIFTYDIYRLPLRNYTFDVVIWIRKKHFQNSTH